MNIKDKPILKIENISKTFQNGTQALQNVDFEIFKNDFILIAGSNGSGKTALMNIIANLEKPSTGKIINNAKDFNINPHIGFIFQDADSQILGETPEEDIVVKTKTIQPKPMDLEEAIMQMELLGHSFFVFKNVDTDKINVVYKRKDGDYGVIEAN